MSTGAIGVLAVFSGIVLLLSASLILAAVAFNMFTKIQWERLTNLPINQILGLGGAMATLAVGLAAFAAVITAGSFMTGLANFLTGGGLIGQLERLAKISDPLQKAAESIRTLSSSLRDLASIPIGALKEVISTMNTMKNNGGFMPFAGASFTTQAVSTTNVNQQVSQPSDSSIKQESVLLDPANKAVKLLEDAVKLLTDIKNSSSSTNTNGEIIDISSISGIRVVR
jgi:hypothetical protein